MIKFPRDPEREAERDRQHAEMRRRYCGQVAMTLIELGLDASEVAAWSESILDRLFVVLPREGGEPCRCSCHPRLPDSDFHDYGFSCSCRLTAEERRRHTEEWQADLAAFRNTPEAAARRARRQGEENELASWLAGRPDVVISSYGGWAPEQWRGSVAGHSFYFRERHDCWRIELDLDVIAEGVVDMTGYGASPVERAAFIVATIRDHLTRTGCKLHLNGIVDLERRLGRRPDWCPACGIGLRGPA